jgi:hypothetical protein
MARPGGLGVSPNGEKGSSILKRPLLALATMLCALLVTLALLTAPVAASFLFPWWRVAVVILGGFFVGYVAARILRKHAQVAAKIGSPPFWARSHNCAAKLSK